MSTPENPLPWWLPTTSAEHRAWLEERVLDSVPYEAMSTHQPWAPGTSVLLRTEDRQHFFYVKVDGAWFRPRWLRTTFANGRQLICPSELTPRDPRGLWSDAWELNLALALLSAPGDPRLEWLRDLDPALEPDLCALRDLAEQELRAVPPTPTTGPAPTSPAPAPVRKAWTKAEPPAPHPRSTSTWRLGGSTPVLPVHLVLGAHNRLIERSAVLIC